MWIWQEAWILIDHMYSLRSNIKGDLVYLLFGERATSGRILSWNFM